MTAKIYAFPSGKQIPALTKEQREPVKKRIADQQTKKYADAVADDIMIQMIGTNLWHAICLLTSEGEKNALLTTGHRVRGWKRFNEHTPELPM